MPTGSWSSMRTKKRMVHQQTAIAMPAQPTLPLWLVFLGIVVVLIIVYERALRGPLLFDDRILPFGDRQLREAPLRAWISGVRPMLMLTYWFNYQFSGTETLGYHLLNVLLHAANGLLVFLLFRALLPNELILCGFGAAIFLLHPLQTESVAYLAGRSELVVASFVLCATLVFLRVRNPSWPWAGGVAALLGAALLSKEQALAAIPFFLLLESGWADAAPDLWATMRARIRCHWRLWVMCLAAGCAGAAWVGLVLSQSKSAGFGLADRTPIAYFFTECRVLFQYLRLFLLPIGQNIDPHPPLSHTFVEHGAGLYLGAAALLICICFRFRLRAPLATFGCLAFLIFLAPTSSFVPLADPMAEHRMYLPIVWLCLVIVDLFRRIRSFERRSVAALTCVLIIYAALSFDRSQVWSSATALAEDAAAMPPLTARSARMLGQAYVSENRPADFIKRLAATPSPELEKDVGTLTELGLALACVGRDEDAVSRLQQALSIKPEPFGFGLKGYLEAKLGHTQESLHDLNRAIELGPDFDAAYGYRGLWYLASNQLEQAADDFRHALSLNPFNAVARDGLRQAERRRAEPVSRAGSAE